MADGWTLHRRRFKQSFYWTGSAQRPQREHLPVPSISEVQGNGAELVWRSLIGSHWLLHS
jgi:hypothetical protein